MALTAEWRNRIVCWRDELREHFYRPLGAIVLSGFVTREQLSPESALKRDFWPMPPGTRWGAKWEYGWFKGQVSIPLAAQGRRVVARLDAGGESAVYLDGKVAGAIDKCHSELTLAMRAEPEERHELLLETYAGHGPRVTRAGPTPPGRVTVPEPGPAQVEVGESSFGIWEEQVYQLWLDVETLFQLRELLDQDSLRVAEIDAGLRGFSVTVDFETSHECMLESVAEARKRLRPLLQCVNGSTAPTMFAFGHAHLDVAWLWPLQETERKIGRTVATQLALMQEYPEYRYLQSQPHLLQMLKTRQPELYRRVKKAVRAGQFVPDGATWVEPDTNVTGGEALVRQLVHGKRFFREEFGVECEALWLPDVFGYTAALPQILRGAGVKYFSTAKILWDFASGEPFPYTTFTWEGIDGSEVLVHLCNNYNALTDPKSLIGRWNERAQKDGISSRLFPFGWGDGGGGPTRDHLEFLRRARDLEGVPRVQVGAPIDFFHDLERRGVPEARYVGELYFQAHRGTYTSQARTKRANRKAELALREAELWGAAAKSLAGFEYPLAEMDRAWKLVLLNQFHDVLPGSSIHRVYEEAEASYAKSQAAADEVARQAAACLTRDGQALTILNSLSWRRAALAPLPAGASGAVTADGATLPAQSLDGTMYVEVSVPPCGWTTVRLTDRHGPPSMRGDGLRATERSLENAHLRLEFDDLGRLSSIFDKDAGRELAAAPCNEFRMFKDVPSYWDAWEIDSTYQSTSVALTESAAFESLASGPLVARLRITRRLNNSLMTQEVSLRRDTRRADFHTVIDWQEGHKLLKVAFPVNVHANDAIHEVQFGHVRRPNHRSRQYDADRFEVCNHKWTALAEEGRGFAVLNDCKYGVNVLGNTISLTLLKSALAPDMTADRGRQEFTYAILPWNGSFGECDVVREAYDLNVPVRAAAGDAGERSLFSLDAPNVVIEAVKPAEDGSADIVVRLYDSKRTATRCTLEASLPVARAFESDLLETAGQEIEVVGGCIPLDFRPFEIKTLRLKLAA